MNIALGQINCVTGDLQGNTEKIIYQIRHARGQHQDLIAFPETAITGYCCGALFDNTNFIKDQLQYLNQIIEESFDIIVVIGFVRLIGTKGNGFPKLANSCAVIQNKQIVHTYDKIYLANNDHHEDRKYFEEGEKISLAEVFLNGESIKIGTPICEDIWYQNHEIDIVKTMKQMGADIIIVPNQSYFYYGKALERYTLLKHHAATNQIPIIYVNNVGVGDIVKNILIYDGNSLMVRPDGSFSMPDKFKAITNFVDTNPKFSYFYDLPNSWANKYQQIYDALKYEQEELFKVLGIKKAQVHISGGIDSAITAFIVQQAMGKENTILITNPSSRNEEKIFNLVKKLSKALDNPYYEQPIQNAVNNVENSIRHSINPNDEEPLVLSPLLRSTIQATIRSCYGLSSTHYFKTAIVSTGNHTEIVLGWANFHDIGSIGVHAIIGDLSKTELFEFAKYINENIKCTKPIPEELYNGEVLPAAELVDTTVDPYDYFIVSGICCEMIRKKKDPFTLIEDYKNSNLTIDYFPLNWEGKSIYENCTLEEFEKEVWKAFNSAKISVFKAGQAAPTAIISPRSRGFSNREANINKWIPLQKH